MRNNNSLGMCVVIQKVSLAVFAVLTAWLMVKSAQLLELSYWKHWFSASEWKEYNGYPGYTKYLLIIWMIALIVLIITSRIKKHN